MRVRSWVAIVVAPLSCALAIFACNGSRVPSPEYQPHPRNAAEAVCVPYPPPAPKPEETGTPPPQMSKRAVWVDGEWIWRSRGNAIGATLGRWEWQGGGWVDPPYGATYSRGTLERLPNGALAFYPPHWHMPDHYVESYSVSAPEGDARPLGPVSSEGTRLDCPPPPKSEPLAPSASVHDAGDEAHVGPILSYPADAPASAPPKVVLDAVIPSDAKEPPKLIMPPESP